jgi:type VI secretion system protein ImpF
MEISFIDRFVSSKTTRRPENAWQEMRELKASLCRDLTDLLNTRRAEKDFDPKFAHCSNSLLKFGIPDFTSFDLQNTADQERVRLSIERAIRQFEPRLVRVRVTLKPPSATQPRLQFIIDAQLREDGESEEVSFDAAVLKETRRIAVSEEN